VSDLYLMALALLVFWITSDREALILLAIWGISAFLFVEDPAWFSFYALSCGAGCVISKSARVICWYIVQSLIALGCLVEWYMGGDFLFGWYKHMIAFCFVMQLAGVTLGNIHFSLSGDILNRNLSFTVTRG